MEKVIYHCLTNKEKNEYYELCKRMMDLSDKSVIKYKSIQAKINRLGRKSLVRLQKVEKALKTKDYSEIDADKDLHIILKENDEQESDRLEERQKKLDRMMAAYSVVLAMLPD